MENMMSFSRHYEDASQYSAEQQQWLRNRYSIEENGPKIAYPSHSTHTAHGAPPQYSCSNGASHKWLMPWKIFVCTHRMSYQYINRGFPLSTTRHPFLPIPLSGGEAADGLCMSWTGGGPGDCRCTGGDWTARPMTHRPQCALIFHSQETPSVNSKWGGGIARG